MKSQSVILWHGTPETSVDPGDLLPRTSYLHALWLTGTPEVAALYAGPQGHVHGFVLDEGVRLLSCFGENGSSMYPSRDVWEYVRHFLVERLYDPDEFDCLNTFKIENGFRPPLGPDGQPSWQSLYDDLSELMDDGEELLSSLGYSGFMQNEKLKLCLGDRSVQIRQNVSREYANLVTWIGNKGDCLSPSVGMLRTDGLRHVCTMPAFQIVRMRCQGLGMPLTDADALWQWSKDPIIPESAFRPAI